MFRWSSLLSGLFHFKFKFYRISSSLNRGTLCILSAANSILVLSSFSSLFKQCQKMGCVDFSSLFLGLSIFKPFLLNFFFNLHLSAFKHMVIKYIIIKSFTQGRLYLRAGSWFTWAGWWGNCRGFILILQWLLSATILLCCLCICLRESTRPTLK